MNLRKVDFFWINRDQRSFEWFVNLLSQLEIEQAELGGAMERFLDMVTKNKNNKNKIINEIAFSTCTSRQHFKKPT